MTAAAAATSVDAARDGALGGTPDFSAPDFSAPDFSPSAVLSTGAPGTSMAVALEVALAVLLVAASLAAVANGLGNWSDSTCSESGQEDGSRARRQYEKTNQDEKSQDCRLAFHIFMTLSRVVKPIHPSTPTSQSFNSAFLSPYLTGQLLDALRLRRRLGLVLGDLRGDRLQAVGGDLGRQLLVGRRLLCVCATHG